MCHTIDVDYGPFIDRRAILQILRFYQRIYFYPNEGRFLQTIDNFMDL